MFAPDSRVTEIIESMKPKGGKMTEDKKFPVKVDRFIPRQLARCQDTVVPRLVIIPFGETIFQPRNRIQNELRIGLAVSWTDWKIPVEKRENKAGGLLVCFPDTDEYVPDAPSPAKEAVDRLVGVVHSLGHSLELDISNVGNDEAYEDNGSMFYGIQGTSEVTADFVFGGVEPGWLAEGVNDVTIGNHGLWFYGPDGRYALPLDALRSAPDDGYDIQSYYRGPHIGEIVILTLNEQGVIEAEGYRLQVIEVDVEDDLPDQAPLLEKLKSAVP